MAWLRIDDRVRTHPKIATAGPAAAWLWFCGICYCREHLTDGFIPAAVVPSLAMNLPAPMKHATRLVNVSLWHIADGGFRVHDFLDWNPSREDIEANRDWGAQRKSLYRNKDVTAGVRERDGDQCRYCGRPVNFNDRRGPGGGQLDHVVPRGPGTFDNIVVACRECNTKKNGRTPEEAGMPLRPIGTSSDPDGGTSSNLVPPRVRARDRAGDAGLGSLSGSGLGSEDLQVEEIPISTAAPAWRQRTARPPAIADGEGYHRRNCAPWAFAACEAGICVPKYLWPQWAKRQPVEALRAFVGQWAPQVAGDEPERFWPRAFAAHFGEAVTRAATSRTGGSLDGAREYLSGQMAALREGGE